MLLIDDLLLAPFRGLLWVAEQVHDAVQAERAGETDAITEELRQLYLLFERGQITEAQFDEREQQLLDRLDAIQEEEFSTAPDGDDDPLGTDNATR
jgi:gas vesicle protein GvpG